MRACWLGLGIGLLVVLTPGPAAARHHRTTLTDDASRAFLRQVRHSLARSHARVAHNTLAAIHDGRVHVLTLDNLSLADCHALLHEEQWRDVHEACVATLDGHARPPERVLADLMGYTHGNRVYLWRDPDVENASSTLMHEVNHVANHSDAHYRTPHDVFIAEYRAYWIEHAARLGHAPAHAECVALKQWILDSYVLKGVRPSEVSDVPPGNITNELLPDDGASTSKPAN